LSLTPSSGPTDNVIEKLALQCLLAFLLHSPPSPSTLGPLDFTQILKGREPSMRLDLYNALLTIDVVQPEVEVVCGMNVEEAFKVKIYTHTQNIDGVL
jgi:hypothetical protein